MMNTGIIAQDGAWVVHRAIIPRVECVNLINAIPGHHAYSMWLGRGEFRLGIGHAWQLVGSRDEDSVGELSRRLRTSSGPLYEYIPFATSWSHFDPNDPRTHDENSLWRLFPSIEVSVPEISYVMKRDALIRTIICDSSRLENLLAASNAMQRNASEFAASRALRVELTSSTDTYQEVVKQGLSAIEDRVVEKVVLARVVSGVGERPIDLPHTLETLMSQFPNCLVFACRPKAMQNRLSPTFFGATPETLVRTLNGWVETEALAGSAPRGISAKQDETLANELLRSVKDTHEHEVVRERIVAGLAAHCTHVEYGEAQIKRLRNVQHIHTPLHARLSRTSSIADLVDALHPTPAVGGHPSQAACELIRTIEGFHRGLYAGTGGWFDASGDGEFGVLIRSALADGENIHLFAGAGIVEGSNPVHEANETQVKLSAILEALR